VTFYFFLYFSFDSNPPPKKKTTSKIVDASFKNDRKEFTAPAESSRNQIRIRWKKSFIHHPAEVECDCIYTTVQFRNFFKKKKEKKKDQKECGAREKVN
jgi:hypothetical protein